MPIRCVGDVHLMAVDYVPTNCNLAVADGRSSCFKGASVAPEPWTSFFLNAIPDTY